MLRHVRRPPHGDGGPRALDLPAHDGHPTGAPPRSLGPGRLSRHGGGVFTGVRSPLRSDAVGVLDADDAAWTPTGLRSSAMPPGGVTRAGCVRQAGHGVRCPDVLTSHIWLPWAPAPWVLA
jgi:hypothetical protein